MITKIELLNFRCYEEHTVFFKDENIIVGKNNAGKSTLIEALRLVSIITKRLSTSSFKSPPNWTNLSKRIIGIMPSISKEGFSTKNIINQYGQSPAKIKVLFEKKEIVELLINDKGKIFAYAKNSSGRFIKSKAKALELEQSIINILPQIGPLLEEEKPLDTAYLISRQFSNLASRHFRNQISYFTEHFDSFKELAEKTWDSLRIVDLIPASKGLSDVMPELLVQESGFATEIGSMGHGLQMWLQTIWFLARIPHNCTVVLDEPDVYMHADLQRKLIRLLRGRYKQIIIATHSLEIMAEVKPENMVIIDRRNPTSKFATDLPDIQKVIYNDIGSIHNLELSRIWSSKKFLMVEGKDVIILKRLHDTLFPNSNHPFDNIPNSDIGGWGGWKYAIGSRYALKNAGDQSLKIYCLLDSDYHIKPEIEERKLEAKKQKLNLHIWKRKEVENYLIIPSAIFRLIQKTNPRTTKNLSVQIIKDKIEELIEKHKEELIEDFGTEIAKYYRASNILVDFIGTGEEIKYEHKNISRLAKKLVERRWKNKIEIAPGKTILRELNKWLAETHKVSFGVSALASEIKRDEISKELIDVLDNIETNSDFKE